MLGAAVVLFLLDVMHQVRRVNGALESLQDFGVVVGIPVALWRMVGPLFFLSPAAPSNLAPPFITQ